MSPAPARRWPAEWETHDATWLGWPHHEPDWPGKFGAIPWAFAEIVRVLHRYERVEILCDDADVREQALRHLRAHDVDLSRCGLHVVPTDRVWLRDSGPTGVYGARGFEWIRWAFNAWAKYDNYAKDEQVASAVAELSGLPSIMALRPDAAGGRLVLEGGGIEGNGAGTLLVTEEWLLSDVQVRNPGMSAADYERAFADYLGVERTIWLGEGCLGDDTHGHVDDIARFVDVRTVVLAYEDDPADENHRRMEDNRRRLERAGGAGGALRIVKLPFPAPVIMEGERLPASYANFYVANGVVIVPTFNDRNDRVALGILAGLFPQHHVIGVHAVDLVWGLGSLHCLTQQQPAATGQR